jgi:hypothetical protein
MILLLGRDHLVFTIYHNITPSACNYRITGSRQPRLFFASRAFL